MLSRQRLLGTVSQGQSDGDLNFKLIKSHESCPGSAQKSPIGT